MRALEYFLVCESVSADQSQKTESFQNVLRMVCIQKVPAHVFAVSAVAAWYDLEPEDDRAECHIRLEVHPPGFEEDKCFKFRRTLQSQSPFESTFFGISNIPLKEEGELVFKLYQDENLVETHTIKVVINPTHTHLHPAVIYSA